MLLILKNILSYNQLIRLLQILCRDRLIQPPGDVHGAGAVVVLVGGRAQEGIGRRAAGKAVRFEFADEQEDAAAALLMMDVPLSRGGVLRCGALALPMEQLAVNGIVVVHGRRRVVFVRLVQRDEEHVQVLL